MKNLMLLSLFFGFSSPLIAGAEHVGDFAVYHYENASGETGTMRYENIHWNADQNQMLVHVTMQGDDGPGDLSHIIIDQHEVSSTVRGEARLAQCERRGGTIETVTIGTGENLKTCARTDATGSVTRYGVVPVRGIVTNESADRSLMLTDYGWGYDRAD